MSEETNVETNDGTWSGLKKTIIGGLSTAILAGGTWVTTHLFGGSDESKEEHKTEQVQPAAQPVINVNLENNNTNQQKQSGGTNTVIRERVVEKAAPAEKKEEKKKDETDSPW
jgi:hypothetical protein